MQETIMKLGAVTIRGRRMKFGAVTAAQLKNGRRSRKPPIYKDRLTWGG
jgi:hypothetical protein